VSDEIQNKPGGQEEGEEGKEGTGEAHRDH
jgi:hypothetical protein